MSRAKLVIDASAALYVASALRETPGFDTFDLIAPPNFPSERTSALAAAVWRGQIPEVARDRVFERLEEMPVTIVDDGKAHRAEARELARSLGWAKTYDAEYVVLARRMDCGLLTTDGRLERGVGRVVAVRRPTSLAAERG